MHLDTAQFTVSIQPIQFVLEWHKLANTHLQLKTNPINYQHVKTLCNWQPCLLPKQTAQYLHQSRLFLKVFRLWRPLH